MGWNTYDIYHILWVTSIFMECCWLSFLRHLWGHLSVWFIHLFSLTKLIIAHRRYIQCEIFSYSNIIQWFTWDTFTDALQNLPFSKWLCVFNVTCSVKLFSLICCCVQVSEVNPRANFRYHIDVERPPDMRSFASQRVNDYHTLLSLWAFHIF